MKTLLPRLVFAAVISITLVQCASSGANASGRLISERVYYFDGKKFLRQEFELSGRPGDTTVRTTQIP